MQKKQTILVVASLLVVVLSVTLAYFTAQIIGKGKNVTINSADLKIIFTDSDGSISGTNIEPGKWNVTKKFTIENKSNETYKYNIVIQDLVNTFVTNGYLQYKITSTNGGYNMTEFKDVPKSETATDTILAYSASIDVGVTQSYTVEFKYSNDESVDQSDDMGKKLSGTLFITEGTEEPTLLSQILADNPTRSTRDTYNEVFTNNTTGTLFTATEKNVHNTTDTTLYYYAGNTTNNWVKFAGFYWRIIRTNADGSIRMLYSGTSPDTTSGYIEKNIKFNTTNDSTMYLGYMYGTSGSLENNRLNTNDSTIKGIIDTWYENNLKTNYTKYLSTSAVYCNDRTYKAVTGRVYKNYAPTYDCTETSDAFSVDNTSAKLTYPIALMTADEIMRAGGKGLTSLTSPYAWYYTNANGGSITGNTLWWLLSPDGWYSSGAIVFDVFGSSKPGKLSTSNADDYWEGVRPAISLKSCIKYSTGNGSSSNPYEIVETSSGC